MLLSNLVEHWAGLRFGLAALHVVALVLLVAVAMAWARHGRRWLLVASCVLTVSVITVVYLATVRPSDIPVDWITILTHGLEGKSIMHLSTRGVNAGASFAFVVSAVAAGSAPNLHDVVWLNLLLALVNAAIFLHLAVYVTGPFWAVPWTLAFALNPATFMASFSELPTNVLAVYFLAGVIGWAVLNDPLGQPRWIRTAAYALCAILTVLTALTRIEVASIGAIALALHGGHALLGAETWSAAGGRLRKACEWPLGFFSDHPAAVVVLCVAGWWLAQAGLPGVGRDEVAGLYPFNPSILGLFAFLPMLALPIGVSVAALFGVMYAIVHLRRFGGLVLSLLIVVRAYFAGEDSYHEMARYLSYVLPAILLLGLFGQEQLYEMARRDWRPNWCRAARIGYLMAWFTLPLPGVPEFFMRPEYHRGGGVAQLLLDLNTQREVRHLVALTENNPQCVFIGRVVEDRGDFRVTPQYDYAVFGKPVAQPVFVPEKDAPLHEVIARYASGAPCVRLYYGGDCNVRFGDHCNQFIAGRRRIDEERFWSRPYNNNPFDYADGAPEIVLATYDWP
jgi:hypothetical protein